VKDRIDLIVFDVDGVLVDVRGSFHRSTIQTVRHFTGKRVTLEQIHQWKAKGGFNDDWKLSTAWIRSLGGHATYEEVKLQFMKFYWGNGSDGNVIRERWLVPVGQLTRWSRKAELALFTGRTQRELNHTLRRFAAAKLFRNVVTMDDIEKLKPHPDGLKRILAGRDPATPLYLGDNVDDALAARRARVPFLGVIPQNSYARRLRRARLLSLGARGILQSARELDGWLTDR
jgi:HAD superfamily phosphatase